MGRKTRTDTYVPNYNQRSFDSPEAYSEWKDREFERVNRYIIERTPTYANREATIPHSLNIIAGYKVLLKKFFM